MRKEVVVEAQAVGCAASEVRNIVDVAVLVLEGVAQGGQRPGPRSVGALVGKARAVVFRKAVEGRVERTVEVIDRVDVQHDVIVLEAAELVLPCARTADREIAAGQEIVLVRVLVGVGRERRISVEPPVRLHAGPAVVVPGSAAVQLAARELVNEINVFPFDSGAGSAIMAMMCREARLLDQAGISVQDILTRLETIRERLTVVFTLDTLDFARMNGRVNALQTVLTSVLHIKPIVILRDGLLQMADKVRTRQKAIEQIINFASKRVGNLPINVAIVHAADPQMAGWLVDKVRRLFNCRELVMTDLSIPVAANLGPGAVGIMIYPVD